MEWQEQSNKQRENEHLLIDSFYESSMKTPKDALQLANSGRKVIKGKNIPWVQNPQGIIRRYTYPGLITDTALDTWLLFVHEVRVHSGRHVHQGGLCLFVLDGKGYTTVDGVRFNWSAGDLICLPIKKGGVEHQHFNLGDKPSRWLALLPRTLQHKFLGPILEQTEIHPNWKNVRGK